MNRLIAAIFAAVLAAPATVQAHPDMEAGAHVMTGAGRAGEASKVQRTVTIGMADSMRFSPAHLPVMRGQTVKIVARNDGAVMHEIVIGTREEIAGHREAMRRNPDQAHAAPYMAHVPPGRSEQIVWQFDRLGTFEFACLLPGHYEAGMTGSITVR